MAVVIYFNPSYSFSGPIRSTPFKPKIIRYIDYGNRQNRNICKLHRFGSAKHCTIQNQYPVTKSYENLLLISVKNITNLCPDFVRYFNGLHFVRIFKQLLCVIQLTRLTILYVYTSGFDLSWLGKNTTVIRWQSTCHDQKWYKLIKSCIPSVQVAKKSHCSPKKLIVWWLPV